MTRKQGDGVLLTGAARILELVATGAPLEEALGALARFFESQADGMLASVLLVEDGVRVRHGAAPSLPAAYMRAIDGEPIGPNQGSCGTAAFLKQPVIVTDIASDPRWAGYRDVALSYGLRACWSVPIMGTDGGVLGTFAMYYREPREPTDELLELARQAGHLAAVAIRHHRHEVALRESQHHLSLVYDHVADVLFQLRVEPAGYRFVAVNPAFSTVTGLKPDQVVGRLVHEVIPEPSRSMVLERYAEAIRTRRSVRWVETTPYPTGTKHGDVAITPVFDAQGQPRYLIGSVRDVTELRRMEDEVRQLQKLEAIGRLSSGIAHDFNNILGVIVGVSHMLRTEVSDAELRGQVDEVVQAAERGANLTRQFLAFGRRQVLEPRVFDLNAVLRDLETMLRRLIRADVALATAYAPALWRVRADPGQIEQVVVNLVVNARDAMPGGGRVVIETANRMLDADYARTEHAVVPGEYVMLAVSDTGHGIDDETRRRIFEPFFTTKEVGRGTGLGLATVFGIVQQSGGYVFVDSKPGEGATFRIYLPRSTAPLDAGAAHAKPRDSAGRRRAKVHVLVVEDEPALCRTIDRMLRVLHYQVTVTASADEALAAVTAERVKPDLLLTDTVMPGMSGVELTERVRAMRPGIKVLRMSGYAHDALGTAASAEASEPFLRKPFDLDELAAGIERALED